ncbi:hypothetical protein CRENBAI_009145 [Crenichthys baileyi]|uniref:Uncharacterized protein n=1 Tax=Crenichthys baileyi TaxID=28760 RepID=A0AAV9S116_9TELE
MEANLADAEWDECTPKREPRRMVLQASKEGENLSRTTRGAARLSLNILSWEMIGRGEDRYGGVTRRSGGDNADRRSVRLASCPNEPSPSSQLRACGIIPGSDVESSHLDQLAELLPYHDFPSPPPPPSGSYGKRPRKSANSPSKRRRGRPAQAPAPASAPPGSLSAPVSPPIDPPTAHGSASSAPAISASFIASMDSLHITISSLTHHLQNLATNTAMSAIPPPPVPPKCSGRP